VLCYTVHYLSNWTNQLCSQKSTSSLLPCHTLVAQLLECSLVTIYTSPNQSPVLRLDTQPLELHIRHSINHKLLRTPCSRSINFCTGTGVSQVMTSLTTMLSVFRHADKLPRPSEYPVENFCTMVFEEMGDNSSLDTYVTEISHHKEKVRHFYNFF
jgi:hypothetical protein